ncbi:MAG: hypothetical protein K0R19_3368 [Bacillota bacterium]|jgi:hypothetical protein|nr:hypothetical protein [Bacillota bacterium]
MEQYVNGNKVTKAGILRKYEMTKAILEKNESSGCYKILMGAIPIYAEASLNTIFSY